MPAWRLACLFTVLSAAFPAIGRAGDGDGGNAWPAIAAAALPSVVSVLPQTGRGEANPDEPEGTGFAIGDGTLVLTADHVLGRANRILIRLADGEVREAQIAVRDADTDIALLEIEPPLPPMQLAERMPLPGETVCAIGNAFGLGPSLTCGVVSATGRRGTGFNRIEDFVQTDAAINPGMSGAPLLDAQGRIAGLVSAIFTKDRDGDLGVNFAASQRLLEAFLADSRDGRIDRRQPGVIVMAQPLPGEIGPAYALVARVAPDSAEARAGIVQGDRIISAGELEIRNQADYLAFMALEASGMRSVMVVMREGERIELEIEWKQ